MPPRELKRPPLVSQKSVPIGHTVPTGLRHTARTTSHCLSPRLLVTGLQSRRLFGRRFRGRMTGPENGVFQLRAYEINLCNEGQRRKIRITTSYVQVENLPRGTVNCKLPTKTQMSKRTLLARASSCLLRRTLTAPRTDVDCRVPSTARPVRSAPTAI